MTVGQAATEITLHTFHVGTGDCSLLSVHRGTDVTRILVDFGSLATPEHDAPSWMLQIASEIASVAGGKLHAIVATGRVPRALGGFVGEAMHVIRSLSPDVIVLALAAAFGR